MTSSIQPFLEIRSALSPAVSPDGELMAFLTDQSGFNQIWCKPVKGGAAWRLTETDEPIGSIAFGPKSRDLLFTMDCGGDERHQLWLLPELSGAPVPLTDAPATVHMWGAWDAEGARITYAANGRDRMAMDIHVMDVATRKAERVYQGTGWREALAFFPDGEALLIRDGVRGNNDQDLYRLDLKTGAYDLLTPREGRVKYVAAKFKKDGSGLFVICDRGRDFHGLGFLSLATGKLDWLVAPEHSDIQLLGLLSNQKKMAYARNDAGWSRLFVRDLESGVEVEATGCPPGVIGSLAWTPDGGTLFFSHEGAATPPDVYSFDPETGTVTNVTRAPKAGFAIGDFVEPTVAAVESFDGVIVPVLVYTPPVSAPAGGYPAVIIVHGGPEAQWTPTFRADIQYFMSRGIMVVAPNVRGSTGYGRTYHEMDDRLKRMDSVADLRAVRLWVGERSDADDCRIAVFGRSYGGFMVLAALTEYPDLWKAGIEFYGIANFVTLLETTGPWRKALRAAEYGDDVEDKAALESFSPIHKLTRATAPLLMAHGLDDPRVPPGESEMVYSCLRGLGHPVEYIRIPHAGHGFQRIEQQRIVFGAVADFIERVL